jgi:hypothetical protein
MLQTIDPKLTVRAGPDSRARKRALLLDVVVVVFIFRPVEPKARLPKGIGRPAACMAYLS